MKLIIPNVKCQYRKSYDQKQNHNQKNLVDIMQNIINKHTDRDKKQGGTLSKEIKHFANLTLDERKSAPKTFKL